MRIFIICTTKCKNQIFCNHLFFYYTSSCSVILHTRLLKPRSTICWSFLFRCIPSNYRHSTDGDWILNTETPRKEGRAISSGHTDHTKDHNYCLWMCVLRQEHIATRHCPLRPGLCSLPRRDFRLKSRFWIPSLKRTPAAKRQLRDFVSVLAQLTPIKVILECTCPEQ